MTFAFPREGDRKIRKNIMGSRTSIMFMSVSSTDISLPISDWTKDNHDVWKLFEDARDHQKNILYDLHGKHGRHFYDILQVKDRCNLKSLDFLSLDILEDEKATILTGVELIPAIRSLTIIIDELLSAIDPLICLSIGRKIDKQKMQIAFDSSEAYNNVELDSYEEEGLFIILKSLLFVMTDALVNNKVFIYVQFTV